MGQLVFQAALGGQTNLVGGNTASTYNLNVPMANDTLVGQNTIDTLTNKTLVAPALGTPASGVLTNTTGLPLTTGVTGVLPIANGGTNSTATATAGGVGYGTGTAHAFTAAGTTGQVLTSAGSGAPTWSTPSSGALVYLGSTTASGASSVNLETGLSSTYDDYVIICDYLTQSATNTYFYIQYKIGGSYQTTNYKYQLEYTDTSVASQYNEVASTVPFTSGVKVAAYAYAANSGSYFNVEMNLRSVNTSTYPIVTTQVTGYSATDRGRNNYSYGLTEATTGTLGGVKFVVASGTFSGVFRIYGIAKS